MKTQYGFRRNRSTIDALFIARRLQDYAERKGQKGLMLLLDWEKAFDKIERDKLMEALERLEVPPRLLGMIRLMYKEPKFKVVVGENESGYYTQQTGIRQG